MGTKLILFPLRHRQVTQREMMEAFLLHVAILTAQKELAGKMERIRNSDCTEEGELVYCRCRDAIINRRLCRHYAPAKGCHD